MQIVQSVESDLVKMSKCTFYTKTELLHLMKLKRYISMSSQMQSPKAEEKQSLLAAIVLSVAAPYININRKRNSNKIVELLFSCNQVVESIQEKKSDIIII